MPICSLPVAQAGPAQYECFILMNTVCCPVSELLPHRAGMLLIDSVSRFDRSEIVVRASSSAQAWYADSDGGMPAWIGIELMAQAVAAWVGLCAREAGVAIKPGVLLGCRHYLSQSARFGAGVELSIVARPIYRDENGMGSFECEILADGRAVVDATINVFEPEDFTVFLQQRRAVQ